jgi:hypothetical protein
MKIYSIILIIEVQMLQQNILMPRLKLLEQNFRVAENMEFSSSGSQTCMSHLKILQILDLIHFFCFGGINIIKKVDKLITV